jgi:large subunit ribosomal protein L13
MRKFTLDAQGKKIGRVASEAAKLLMGKDAPDFARNTIAPVEVEIINASKADISAKRMKKDLHPRYSGYNSGLSIQTVEQVISKKGHKEVFRKAIYGMLPINKLRPRIMKHLTIKD